MPNKFLLQLPTESVRLVVIVSSIPNSWSWFDGVLSAPPELIASGEAVEGIGFRLSRFGDPGYVGKQDSERPSESAITAMIVQRKLPGFIVFDTAGFENRPISFKATREIAAAYIVRGYRGNLSAYRDHHRNNKYDNSAVFSLHPKGLPPAFVHTNEGKPHINLDWDPRFGGSAEHVQLILEACRTVGASEFPALA